MAKKPIRIGAVQMRIMRALWRHGKATAREITDALSAERAIAHSTVQTLLRKLEAKGVVAHEVEGRTFIFVPLVTEEEVQQSATQELLGRVFDGSAYGLVARLVESKSISRQELERIRGLTHPRAETAKTSSFGAART